MLVRRRGHGQLRLRILPAASDKLGTPYPAGGRIHVDRRGSHSQAIAPDTTGATESSFLGPVQKLMNCRETSSPVSGQSQTRRNGDITVDDQRRGVEYACGRYGIMRNRCEDRGGDYRRFSASAKRYRRARFAYDDHCSHSPCVENVRGSSSQFGRSGYFTGRNSRGRFMFSC